MPYFLTLTNFSSLMFIITEKRLIIFVISANCRPKHRKQSTRLFTLKGYFVFFEDSGIRKYLFIY